MFRNLFFSLSLLGPVCLGCQKVEPEPMRDAAQQQAQPAAVVATPPRVERERADARTLLELPASAYSAQLHVVGDALYVITPEGISRGSRAGKFSQKSLRLGSTLGARGDELLFTDEGFLRSYRWGDKSSNRLQPDETPSERLAATGAALFSLHRTKAGHSTLSVQEKGAWRILYESSTSIATLAAKDDTAFFVEATGGGFRLGQVKKDGTKTFGQPRTGRTPSQLSVADRVYYYDGPSGEVRGASLSLAHEDVVARDVVCSPLHVADKLFCAYPGALVAIGLHGAHEVELEVETRGPVTTITTLDGHLLWIEDAGAQRLAVRSVPLSPSLAADPGAVTNETSAVQPR